MATNVMHDGDQLGSAVFMRHGKVVDGVPVQDVPVQSSVTKYRCLSVS